MILADWLAYIEQLHPQNIALGLERVQEVFKRLQLTHIPIVVTVTGTNGKGTTIATLEAIYQQAGYRVGAYTSPHLWSFNERIRIQGNPLQDTPLCEAFAAIEKARGEVALTYFEFTTLAAFWLFAQKDLDIWLLEVGMGGRLDAVNILSASVAVITNVDLDHQDWLGATREAIAQEKLGIAREGQFLVYGETAAPPGFHEAVAEKKILLRQIGEHFTYRVEKEAATWRWQSREKEYSGLFLAPFIPENMACALEVVECLQFQLPVTLVAIQAGLQRITLSGRCQIIAQTPWQIVDVAHNPHASTHLAGFLKQHRLFKKGKLKAVFSALKDKDHIGIVAPLLQIVDEWYVAGLAEELRGDTATRLHALLRTQTDNPIFSYENVILAHQAALAKAEKNDSIVIFGSFHTVAKVYSAR